MDHRYSVASYSVLSTSLNSRMVQFHKYTGKTLQLFSYKNLAWKCVTLWKQVQCLYFPFGSDLNVMRGFGTGSVSPFFNPMERYNFQGHIVNGQKFPEQPPPLTLKG